MSAAELQVGGSLTATSDYVFRGISQNRGDPALQGDVHLQSSRGWTVGLWASQVSLLRDSHSAELDAYASWRWPLAQQFGLEAGAVYYAYPDDPRPAPYDYLELMARLTWQDLLTLGVAVAPEVNLFRFGYGLVRDQLTMTTELTAQGAIGRGWSVNAGIGYYDAPDLDMSYAYGSAGLALDWKQLRAELSYIEVQDASDRPYLSGLAGGPWVATLSWRF